MTAEAGATQKSKQNLGADRRQPLRSRCSHRRLSDLLSSDLLLSSLSLSRRHTTHLKSHFQLPHRWKVEDERLGKLNIVSQARCQPVAQLDHTK